MICLYMTLGGISRCKPPVMGDFSTVKCKAIVFNTTFCPALSRFVVLTFWQFVRGRWIWMSSNLLLPILTILAGVPIVVHHVSTQQMFWLCEQLQDSCIPYIPNMVTGILDVLQNGVSLVGMNKVPLYSSSTWNGPLCSGDQQCLGAFEYKTFVVPKEVIYNCPHSHWIKRYIKTFWKRKSWIVFMSVYDQWLSSD